MKLFILQKIFSSFDCTCISSKKMYQLQYRMAKKHNINSLLITLCITIIIF